MTISAEEFKARTKRLAVRIIRLCDTLPHHRSADVISRQLLRSGTSIGANYRAACRTRIRAEFCAKLGIVEEEADETIYWIELLVETKLVREDLVSDLLQETQEILSMIVASLKTSNRHKRTNNR